MIDWEDELRRKLRERELDDAGSHAEQNAHVFHPSALSRCKRQCAISKLGLEDHSLATLWNFYLGTRQHEDLAAWFEDRFGAVEFEKELETEVEREHGIVRIDGRCDVYDPVDGAIYDFKTRKSWKGYDGAKDPHKDQLTAYMAMAGVDRGQLVYVIKSAPWDDDADIVRTWPEDGFFEFDEDRWTDMLDRATSIKARLEEFEDEHGRLPESRDELPFESCGCWICRSEEGSA